MLVLAVLIALLTSSIAGVRRADVDALTRAGGRTVARAIVKRYS